jgi:hypothetical protein
VARPRPPGGREVDVLRRAWAHGVLDRAGRAEEVALRHGDIEVGQRLALGVRFDALGNQATANPVCEEAHPGHESLANRIGIDASYDPRVDLHVAGPQLEDVSKAGVAGARIIHAK